MSQKRLLLTLCLIFAAAFAGLWLRGRQLLNQDAVAQRAGALEQPDEAGAEPNPAGGDEAPLRNVDEEEFTPTTKNPFIRALEELLGASPILKSERDELQKQMQEADTVLTQAKKDGASALKQANRQVRVRNANSPNLILIVAEGLACEDLGCYGGTTIATPEIDRMADQGVRFTQFYAGNSTAAGSHWSLMTAFQTIRATVSRTLSLRPSDVTIAEVLWQAGYTTELVGDTALAGILDSSDPQQNGFDRSYGYDRREDATGYPEYVWENSDRRPVEENSESKQAVRGDEVLTREVVSSIQRHRRGRPFFLYLTFAQPQVSDSTEHGDSTEDGHAAMVSRLDAHVGSIRQALQRSGMDRNTIIMLTGEGGASGSAIPDSDDESPLRGGQGDLYEGGIRAPLIVCGSRHVSGGVAVDRMCAAWDLLPTLADLVGAWHRPGNIDGISLRGSLSEKSQAGHKFLAWASGESEPSHAVRIDDWKAVRSSPDSDIELYDLSVDRGESNNVASQHPDITERIERFLDGSGEK